MSLSRADNVNKKRRKAPHELFEVVPPFAVYVCLYVVSQVAAGHIDEEAEVHAGLVEQRDVHREGLGDRYRRAWHRQNKAGSAREARQDARRANGTRGEVFWHARATLKIS